MLSFPHCEAYEFVCIKEKAILNSAAGVKHFLSQKQKYTLNKIYCKQNILCETGSKTLWMRSTKNIDLTMVKTDVRQA